MQAIEREAMLTIWPGQGRERSLYAAGNNTWFTVKEIYGNKEMVAYGAGEWLPSAPFKEAPLSHWDYLQQAWMK